MLGASSQVPARHRNHNGYLLRWDGEGFAVRPRRGLPTATPAGRCAGKCCDQAVPHPLPLRSLPRASCNVCRWTGCDSGLGRVRRAERPRPVHRPRGLAQPFDNFEEAALFFKSALGLQTHEDIEIPATYGLFRSRAVNNRDRSVRIITARVQANAYVIAAGTPPVPMPNPRGAVSPAGPARSPLPALCLPRRRQCPKLPVRRLQSLLRHTGERTWKSTLAAPRC